MATQRIGVKVEFEFLTCSSCGIMYAMTRQFVDRRRKDCVDFYCPKGHTNAFCKDEEGMDAEQEEIDLQKQVNRRLGDRLREKDEWGKGLTRSNAALRGQITKLKKKLSKGGLK